MRDTLDGVFTALLDEAYDWGAGLLKWGGDALLLMFDGPDHAKRAARAAWEMQGTIDRVGRLHLSGGTIVLRMSVGIGTGMFHFFMTGSVHRELLIAGPAMTETLSMEAHRGRRRDRHQPGAGPAPRPGVHRRAEGRHHAPGRAARRSSASVRRSSASVEGLDIALGDPGRGARPRPAAQERARAPDDHGRLHRHDGHGPAARGDRARGARVGRSTSGCVPSRRPRSATRCPSTRPTSASPASRRC